MTPQQPMSQWTHALCTRCWTIISHGLPPSVLKDPDIEHCCRCGIETASGIYVRGEPTKFPCEGRHAAVSA